MDEIKARTVEENERIIKYTKTQISKLAYILASNTDEDFEEITLSELENSIMLLRKLRESNHICNNMKK